ncbi:MAG: winged helix-turn-helix domain-containing protein [Candidatus Woesearchaeota archaeon]|jgi:predicted transcriptional regulator|nr:winged helix-turn-helix domain-containing protein [Candidatus Woesearchaeota archaeon]|tara:strand:- start:1053 stop:1460 length:408 start_codon:yes stop_codon:yes gene_type:complete
MRYIQRITITNIRKPVQRNVNQELQWLGSSLGLFNLRDKDKSCFRVFIELVKTAKKGVPLSSDELAFRLGLSRGTVIHHIHKLLDSGIVVQANKGYILRVDSLRELIDEVEKDLRRTCNDLRSMAQEIDESLGLH